MNVATPPQGRIPVTVVAGHRRADLALPGALPVAELLPPLAGHAGLLDPANTLTGHQLTTYDGQVLSPDRGLVVQGVTPGAILVLQPGPETVPPTRYDDPVEAIADAVHDLGGGPARGVSEAADTLARVLLAVVLPVGALGLVSDHTSPFAAAIAAAIAVTLLMCAGAFSRRLHDPGLAVLAAVSASVYAATCGLDMAWGDPVLGAPAAVGGGAGAATAALACALVGGRRSLLLPPALIGGVFLAAGSAAPVVDPVAALTIAAVVAAAASPSFPMLAVALTPTGRLGAQGGDLIRPYDGVDALRVADDVRLAHRLVATWTATAGLLVLMVAPLAAASGTAGTISVALAALVLALEPAARRGATAALVGAGSGVLGLMTAGVAALWLHPHCRPVLAPALAAAALLLLVDVSLRRGSARAVRTRMGELVEAAALLGIAPAVVLAVGSWVGLRLELP